MVRTNHASVVRIFQGPSTHACDTAGVQAHLAPLADSKQAEQLSEIIVAKIDNIIS